MSKKKQNSSGGVKLTADERLRRELDERKCNWELRDDVPFSAIDVSDNEYQTRVDCHTADKELVAKYAEGFTAGDAFPEIVLAAKRSSRTAYQVVYSIVCGKHRVLAAKAAGFLSCNAIVVLIDTEEDKKKARDVSSHDNWVNGKGIPPGERYEQLAQECISENGGLVNGLPPAAIVSQVAKRHSVVRREMLNGHIHRLLFQHECRRRKCVPPAGVDVCQLAYSYVDKEGFTDLVRAVSDARDTKGLVLIMRDGRQRKKNGREVAEDIANAANGYLSGSVSSRAMPAVARVQCALETVRKLMEGKLALDPSVTDADCNSIEAALEHVCECGATVVQALRRKVRGA